ncbi:hypothetical protein [uncultured Kordia sp.]|uniref:hypothetical protein n=1 Tax=uncultured Kordia sp. TaxID=507699 RepID=UPI002612C855|nr:hypothetical protein [uncultured Kordia sp.]
MREVLLGFEFCAALVGCLYFVRLKNTYWKWFSLYLLFIFIQDLFWIIIIPPGSTSVLDNYVNMYYTFVGIPIQYLFFFWLYASKSLSRKNLFYGFSSVYILFLLVTEVFLKEYDLGLPVNIIIGTFLLTTLVILEFIKQVQNENTLKFKENKMFYINTGILLFYFGTCPLSILISNASKELKNLGYTPFIYYFLISNCLMYLLFSASFIWGKNPSK